MQNERLLENHPHIMSLFRYLAKTFSAQPPEDVPIRDSTLYLIRTKTRMHEGFIVHQSDMMIKFLCTNDKSITILKSNILQIKIAFN